MATECVTITRESADSVPKDRSITPSKKTKPESKFFCLRRDGTKRALTESEKSTVPALTQGEISSVLKSAHGAMAMCWKRRFQGENWEKLYNGLNLSFVVSTGGKTKNLEIAYASQGKYGAQSSMQDTELLSCVSTVIQELQFAEPRGSVDVLVSLPWSPN